MKGKHLFIVIIHIGGLTNNNHQNKTLPKYTLNELLWIEEKQDSDTS